MYYRSLQLIFCLCAENGETATGSVSKGKSFQIHIVLDIIESFNMPQNYIATRVHVLNSVRQTCLVKNRLWGFIFEILTCRQVSLGLCQVNRFDLLGNIEAIDLALFLIRTSLLCILNFAIIIYSDALWKDLVDNPKKWWDNRSNKVNITSLQKLKIKTLQLVCN